MLLQIYKIECVYKTLFAVGHILQVCAPPQVIDVRVAAVSITELGKVGWKRLNIEWLAKKFDPSK